MPTTDILEVKNLDLDLKNFRTVPQKKETDAIKAMIAIKPDRFYGVMESLLDDGYLPTENIIVLKVNGVYTVKEGNRRIAALKLAHGIHKVKDFAIPASLLEKLKKIDEAWFKANSKVPCTIFNSKEEELADRVVTLAHGKGEKASRDPWSSVARARHNRNVKGASETGLDLLEKYLKQGQNLNNQQKERWSGDFPLTVLDEALRKLHSKMGFANAAELVKKYPKISQVTELEEIIREIGLAAIGFEAIRSDPDFGAKYGIVQPSPPAGAASSSTPTSSTAAPTSGSTNAPSPAAPSSTPTQSPSSSTSTSPASGAGSATPAKAYGSNDPRHIATLLKKFAPRGANRQKVVTLRDELRKLKIKDHPFSFCFLLRSMFEISAKAYCNDHTITTTKSNGQDKSLTDLLRDVTNHLTNNNANQGMMKALHGALTEIAKPASVLSVTSMNQLVHNPSFSVQANDICIMFGNVYPLLEAMN